LATI